jgi:hypothetical protein
MVVSFIGDGNGSNQRKPLTWPQVTDKVLFRKGLVVQGKAMTIDFYFLTNV